MGATLTQLIDRLNESIGAGANTATLRSQLALLREQTEAVDAHIQELEARIEQYETQPQFKNPSEKQNRLEEGAEKILKFLFDNADNDEAQCVGIMAGSLGMQKGVDAAASYVILYQHASPLMRLFATRATLEQPALLEWDREAGSFLYGIKTDDLKELCRSEFLIEAIARLGQKTLEADFNPT